MNRFQEGSSVVKEGGNGLLQAYIFNNLVSKFFINQEYNKAVDVHPLVKQAQIVWQMRRQIIV